METAALASGVSRQTLYLWLRTANAVLARDDGQSQIADGRPEAQADDGRAKIAERKSPDASLRAHEGLCVEFLKAMEQAEAEADIADMAVVDEAAKTDWRAASWRMNRRERRAERRSEERRTQEAGEAAREETAGGISEGPASRGGTGEWWNGMEIGDDGTLIRLRPEMIVVNEQGKVVSGYAMGGWPRKPGWTQGVPHPDGYHDAVSLEKHAAEILRERYESGDNKGNDELQKLSMAEGKEWYRDLLPWWAQRAQQARDDQTVATLKENEETEEREGPTDQGTKGPRGEASQRPEVGGQTSAVAKAEQVGQTTVKRQGLFRLAPGERPGMFLAGLVILLLGWMAPERAVAGERGTVEQEGVAAMATEGDRGGGLGPGGANRVDCFPCLIAPEKMIARGVRATAVELARIPSGATPETSLPECVILRLGEESSSVTACVHPAGFFAALRMTRENWSLGLLNSTAVGVRAPRLQQR